MLADRQADRQTDIHGEGNRRIFTTYSECAKKQALSSSLIALIKEVQNDECEVTF
jgi:hypothetical protein